MATFTYDSQTLRSASKDLATGSTNIQSELGSLANRIAPLRDGFKGAAAEGFQALFEQWQQSAKQLRESLEGLSQLLEGAAGNAEQMEDANTKMMKGNG